LEKKQPEGTVNWGRMTGNSEVKPKRLVSSIKGAVKKKHTFNGWNFSCFAAHLFKQDLF